MWLCFETITHTHVSLCSSSMNSNLLYPRSTRYHSVVEFDDDPLFIHLWLSYRHKFSIYLLHGYWIDCFQCQKQWVNHSNYWVLVQWLSCCNAKCNSEHCSSTKMVLKDTAWCNSLFCEKPKNDRKSRSDYWWNEILHN